MGPFAAAYVAYKKGKVVKQAEGPGDHALDLGFRWCRYRGRSRDVRLQDHERDWRETDCHYAFSRVLYRARRRARRDLRHGPGLAPLDDALPDRRDRRRRAVRRVPGRHKELFLRA